MNKVSPLYKWGHFNVRIMLCFYLSMVASHKLLAGSSYFKGFAWKDLWGSCKGRKLLCSARDDIPDPEQVRLQ